MKYLLCSRCSRAWLAPVAASCCGTEPVTCSPWSSDARAWFRARLADRAADVFATANYRDRREHKRSLVRGIRARGNETVRLVA